jgi:hypothetical protein
MDSSQFGKLTSLQGKTLQYYFERPGPLMVVREVTRFIQRNFELQGWQGATFKPWKANKKGLVPILARKHHLQRGFNYTLQGNGDVLFYNNIPYARAHNEGFKGQVTVRAHSRKNTRAANIYNTKSHRPRAVRVEIGEPLKIEEFTRNMDLVQRQFAPTEDSPSPILEAEIIKWLEADIKAILTKTF